MILTQKEKEQISQTIKEVEAKSGAELVAVITQKSGDYALAFSVKAAIFLFLFSAITVYYMDFSSTTLLNAQIIFLALLSGIFYLRKDKFMGLLPSFYKKEKASEFAHKEFKMLGINRTKTRQGVMFFVSIRERYVEIIADEAISKKIDDSYWEEIVRDFITHVKKDEFALGYKEAIGKCSKILIEKFPISHSDENELSDEVVEL